MIMPSVVPWEPYNVVSLFLTLSLLLCYQVSEITKTLAQQHEAAEKMEARKNADRDFDRILAGHRLDHCGAVGEGGEVEEMMEGQGKARW